jgi:hypothetical protein
MRILLANRRLASDDLSSDDVRLTLLSFDSYPNLCQPPQNLPLTDGVAKATIQLDASCRFTTLVITHTGAIAGDTMVQDFAVKLDAVPEPGDVFVSVGEAGMVNIYRPDGTQMTTWDTRVFGDITGSAFDAAGNFYVTNFDAARVSKFAPDGTLLGGFGSGYTNSPESILFDANGDAYVGHADGTKDVHKRAPDGSLITAFDVGVEDRGSDWIALRPDGCTLVYTSEGSRVLQYDVCTAQQLPDFAATTGTTYAVGLLQDGGAVVSATSVVRRFNAQGSQIQTYDAPGQNNWFSLGLDPDGTSFWAGDLTNGWVYRFDISTGQVLRSIQAGTLFWGAGGITVKPDVGTPIEQATTQQDKKLGTSLGFWAPAPGQEPAVPDGESAGP